LRLNAPTDYYSDWYSLPTTGWSVIEITVTFGATSTAALYIDGDLQETVTGGNAAGSGVETVAWGWQGGAANGTYYLDNLVLDDASYIGLISGYGDDLFVIMPDGQDEIVCTMLQDVSNNYQVPPIRIDLNEAERLKVVYSDGKITKRSMSAPVTITFQVLVYGSTNHQQVVNFRKIATGILNPRGGWLKFKPLGLDDLVRPTFYRYLPSDPPKPLRAGAWHQHQQQLIDDTRAGADSQPEAMWYEVKLVTEAVAVSDPASLIEIVEETTLLNADEGSADNSVVVYDGQIKGDLFIPVVRFRVNAGSDQGHGVFMHRRKMVIGNSTYADYLEAEDMTQLDGVWSNQALSSASGDSYKRSGDTPASIRGNLSGLVANLDSSYMGKITPIVIARADAGSTFSVTFKLRHPLYTDTAIEQACEKSLVIDDANWIIYHELDELDFPPIPLPAGYDDDTATTIAEVVFTNLYIIAHFERLTGSGNIEVDFIWYPKANDWIGLFTRIYSSITTSQYLIVDAINKTSFLEDNSGTHYGVWNKYGSPYEDLFLERGFDHRLRFLYYNTNGYYDAENEPRVTVQGLYGTIYPFETM
jgi:hypothetical protein